MPNPQQTQASAQEPSNNALTGNNISFREGRVTSDHHEYYPVMSGFIKVKPNDGGGPLKNGLGITDADLIITENLLVAATADNRQQGISRGEGAHDEDPQFYFLRIGDKVRLKYLDGCLVAVTKT